MREVQERRIRDQRSGDRDALLHRDAALLSEKSLSSTASNGDASPWQRAARV